MSFHDCLDAETPTFEASVVLAEIRFIGHVPGSGSYAVFIDGRLVFGPATLRECGGHLDSEGLLQ